MSTQVDQGNRFSVIAPTTDQTPLPRLPARPLISHKGTFGTVLVIGGHGATGLPIMAGAPALAALGALRAGAGLARLLMPSNVLQAGLAACPSATGIALAVDEHGEVIPATAAEEFDRQIIGVGCIVVGPGMGRGPASLVLRSLHQDHVPVVVDADALNILSTLPEFWREVRGAAVFTPHPGEFRRLASALSIMADPTDVEQRALGAAELARRLGCIVALKGAGTVVSDGQRAWTCPNGHPCLATGGTGDVLAGLIAGLCAQYFRPHSPTSTSLYDLTRIAVSVHARSGERWAREHEASAGLLATDLAALLPRELELMRSP